MKLQLVSIERDGLVKIATQGNITSADIDAAGPNPLEKILGKNWSQMRVLLDLNDTQYIDSSAIGWLIGSGKHLREGGGTLVVYGVQPAVRQVLDLLKVGRVVPLVGRLVARDSGAYSYLPESVAAFLPPDRLAAEMVGAGLQRVRWRRLGLGSVTLHVGTV